MTMELDVMTYSSAFHIITGLAGSARVICRAPTDGRVLTILASVNEAFTTSDIVITGRIGTTPITDGVITLPYSGSGFGTSGSVTPTADNDFSMGNILNVTITGGDGSIGGIVTFVVIKLGEQYVVADNYFD